MNPRNNVISVIFAILLLSIGRNAAAQEDTISYQRFEFSIETGYAIPIKETFRSNYDRGLFIGNTKIPPFFLGIGVAYSISSNASVYLETRRLNNLLSSNDRISVAVVPVLLGVRYYLPEGAIDMNPLKLFIGGGAGFYWARVSIEYRTNGVGPGGVFVPIVDAQDATNQYGFGAQGEIGVDIPASERVSFGMRLTCDINRLGGTSTGGLGNLGGFGISGTFRIRME